MAIRAVKRLKRRLTQRKARLKRRTTGLHLQERFVTLRRLVLFGLSIITTLGAAGLMTDVLGAQRFTLTGTLIVALFTINFLWIAISFYTSIAGLIIRIFGLDPISLKRYRQPDLPDKLSARTVIVIPVYNEDPTGVFARIRATYESLKKLGHEDAFDFFVLSDTRDPDIWIAEELAWAGLKKQIGLKARVYYRRREMNVEKKSGNLMDFCEKWAGAYDFMVVYDADSLMTGEALVRLAHLMEVNPKVGLIQSPPQAVGRHTLFARILQFISLVHGPTMTLGLTFWSLGSSNYWGHNAIIRTEAFINCCGLPILSGKPPLGGPILSHDFVEAAFLRRGGWEVWLKPDIAGSWEELPPNIIDYAVRDRRWCQGNLQHIRVVFGSGLRALSRLHLFMGVMSFVSSPLWFLLLLVSTFAAFEVSREGHSFFTADRSLFPAWPIDRANDMLALLTFTLGMLIVPKFLSVFYLMARQKTAVQFGGRIGLLLSSLFELVFSALLAPVMMLLHTSFVVGNLTGKQVAWDAQVRGDAGVPWWGAIKAHKWHMLLGALWAVFAYSIDPAFFWWMTPVLLGLVLSGFITFFTSQRHLGVKARNASLFVIPEEYAPPFEITRALELEEKAPPSDPAKGLVKLLEDPFASALHQALVPASAPTEKLKIEIGILYEKLARLGPESLTRDEKAKLLSYPVKPLDHIAAGRARKN